MSERAHADEEKQSLVVHRDDFLGEHEQVRAAPAFQLNFLQHVFTIVKQHGRADDVWKNAETMNNVEDMLD